MKRYYTTFCGHTISDYGLQHGYVDYRTLAKCFDAVLCNNIFNRESAWESIELISGSDYDEESDTYVDVFQWYIVSDNAVELLKEASEIVYYDNELDVYIWGVTHYGTSWDYVLTDIPCRLIEE